MEAKMSQKGIPESMFFWLGFGMALETLAGLRRGCGGAAGDPRVGHFLQRIPQGGPRARGVIKQKQAKTERGWRMTERAAEGLSERSCNALFERSEFKGLETEGGTTGHADLTRPWGGCFDWPVQHFLTFDAQEPCQERYKKQFNFSLFLN